MKITAIFLFFLNLFFSAGLIGASDIQSEFSGIKWGTNTSEIDGLREVSRKENVEYYEKPGAVYTIDDLNLGQIIYAFYQNKFFAAYLKIKSNQEFNEIKKYLIAAYGAPRAQLRVSQTIYIWNHRDIKIKLKRYENEEKFKLAFYYLPLSTRLNEIRLEKNAEISMELVPKN